jgi:hypothetical protein
MRFRGEIIGEVIGFARTESDDAMIINQKSRRSKNANFGNKKKANECMGRKAKLNDAQNASSATMLSAHCFISCRRALRRSSRLEK